jgi:hypothetical protein
VTRVTEPAECLDHATAVKSRDKVAAELETYRAKYGRVELVERLYARRLAEYDARISEFRS